MSTFQISNRPVGASAPCLLIAEVGLAHEGSLGYARAFVDAAASAGVDAVKFQTHIAEAESTPRENFRVPVFPQDKTRYDYWKRTGFTLDEWKQLADYVRNKGMLFLSSPFSELAVDWLLECQVPAWKIASGEVSNIPMLEKIAATKLPVLLSTGMSPWSELDEATKLFRDHETPFAIFQCTTAYPCPPETWGLNLLSELQTRYDCPVGLSDHSGSLVPGIAAVAMGAKLLEFHITFHRGMFGPDVSSSLTMEQTAELVLAIRNLEHALAKPVDKDAVSARSAGLRGLFNKSIVAAKHIPAGTVLSREHLAFKKPGDGMPAREYGRILGRTTRTVLAMNDLVREENLS